MHVLCNAALEQNWQCQHPKRTHASTYCAQPHTCGRKVMLYVTSMPLATLLPSSLPGTATRRTEKYWESGTVTLMRRGTCTGMPATHWWRLVCTHAHAHKQTGAEPEMLLCEGTASTRSANTLKWMGATGSRGTINRIHTHRIVVAQAQGSLIGLEGLIATEHHLVREGLEDGLTHRHNAGDLHTRTWSEHEHQSRKGARLTHSY